MSIPKFKIGDVIWDGPTRTIARVTDISNGNCYHLDVIEPYPRLTGWDVEYVDAHSFLYDSPEATWSRL